MNHIKPDTSRPLFLFYRDPILILSIISTLLFLFVLQYLVTPPINLLWPINQPKIFILLVLVYPILEEIVFRGALLEFLHRRIQGNIVTHISKANVVSTLLFTALHFINHPFLWASSVIIPSLLFGYFKEKYNSLLPPIFLHIFFNASYYWIFGN